MCVPTIPWVTCCCVWLLAAVVDILDIKWESLVSEDKPKPLLPGSALSRFSAHHILHDVGVSAAFAGDALIQKLKTVCQQHMDNEASKLAAAAAAAATAEGY